MECEFRFLCIPTRKYPCRFNIESYLPNPTIAIYNTIILNYNTSEVHIKFSYRATVMLIQFILIITLI